MEDVTNILKNDDELNEEQLKKYISGDLSAEELHAVEKQMVDSDFVNDAVEGLQTISSINKLDDYVQELNKQLHQQLNSTKQRREKRKIKHLSWIIVAVIIILLLCVLGFVVIKMYRERQAERISITTQYIIEQDQNHSFYL